MTDSAEVYNPFGIIWAPGVQFPEARNFLRIYGGNPFAQSTFLATLLGLHATAVDNWVPNSETRPTKEDSIAAAEAIGETIVYFAEQFTEWRIEGFEADSDFGLPVYHPDPRLIDLVDLIIESKTEESKSASI